LNVLIQTIGGDIHAAAVAAVLKRYDVEVVFSVGDASPVDQVYSFAAEESGETRLLRLHDQLHVIDNHIDIVWCRRRGRLDTSFIHPDDLAFASREFRAFFDGFWEGAARDAIWINPWQSRKLADTKIKQLSVARAIGFPISPTLISNDPEKIVEFVSRHGIEKIIFKTIFPAVWDGGGDSVMVTNATAITEDLLEAPDDLRRCPGIYQVLVDKVAELRITVMGDRVYCAEIIAGNARRAAVDWRVAQHEMQVLPFDLLPEICELCRRLVSGLGLTFGCLDVLLGKDGQFYFLEVNEMGQFLWIEDCCPELCYLEAFVQFLFRAAGSGTVPTGIALSEVRRSRECGELIRMISETSGRKTAS